MLAETFVPTVETLAPAEAVEHAPAEAPLVDPYAHIIDSPIAIVRIPARREREYLAYQILGRTYRPDGTLRAGTTAEQAVARTWLGGPR